MDWPDKKSYNTLLSSAGGLFIWASTAMGLLAKTAYPQTVLSSLTASGGRTLDVLYAMTLDASKIEWTLPEAKEHFLSVLGLILFGREPLNELQLDGILGTPSCPVLSRLQSLLNVSSDRPIHPVHAFFGDYLTGPNHCWGRAWFVDRATVEARIALRCFRVMKEGLKFNICNLETYYLRNNDVPDLEARVQQFIPPELVYACRHWGTHSAEAIILPEIVQELDVFLRRFLFWLEVLSLSTPIRTSKCERVIQMAMEQTNVSFSQYINVLTMTNKLVCQPLDWQSMVVHGMLKDALAFLKAMDYQIMHQTPHIYLSALPFSPLDNQICCDFIKDYPNLVPVKSYQDQGTNELDSVSLPVFTALLRKQRLDSFHGIVWECMWDMGRGSSYVDHQNPVQG